MDIEKRKRFLINVAFVFVIAALTFFAFKYLINLIIPFFIAFCFAMLLKPLVGFLAKKFPKIKEPIISAVVVTVFFATIGVLLVLLGIRLFSVARELFSSLPSLYSDYIEPTLTYLFDELSSGIGNIDPNVSGISSEFVTNFTDSLGNAVSSLSVKAVTYLTSLASGLPGLLIRVLFTVISTYYLSRDYTLLSDFIFRQFSPETNRIATEVRQSTAKIIFQYIRSYALIIVITFSEVTVGLLLLRVPNAVLKALLIALFDILPVVGTGTIVIPWAVFELIGGNYTLALGLMILYVIIFVVRNIIEPKIIGANIGLHPVLTLICMFVGGALFGVIGLFGLPILAALIYTLNENKVITIFK